MAKKLHLFPDVDYDSYTVPEGYTKSILISVFDHILTEEEAFNSKIMSYDLAKSVALLDDYYIGENRYLKLYNQLAVGGVICNFWNDQKKEMIEIELFKGELLNEVFIKSLREEELMDVYFTHFNIRVIGGYDRTDSIFFTQSSDISIVNKLIKENGLYIYKN